MHDFDRQPILNGSSLMLRPLRKEDWDGLYAVAADPILWADHPAQDRWRESAFRGFFDKCLASGGALAFIDAVTETIIGASRYDFGDTREGEVAIGGTLLSRDRWGGATNAEIKRLMIDHALDSMAQVIFLIGERNIRSRRAMEKIGGLLTDRVHDPLIAGIPVRHLVYAIDRANFASGPLAGADA